MNINQILDQGNAATLEPVKILKDYGFSKGKVGNRALLIEDASGKTLLKLWGACGRLNLNEGDTVSVTSSGPDSKIQTEEYNNRLSINVFDCHVHVSPNGGPGTTQPTPDPTPYPAQPAYTNSTPQPQQPVQQFPQQPLQQQVAPPVASTQLPPEQMQIIRHGAQVLAVCVAEIHAALQAQGLPPEIVQAAASSAGGTVPDWWFFDKEPGKRS